MPSSKRSSRRAGEVDGWRFEGCTMYVTLEPCAMCAGALVNARFERLVFGALDPKAGFCGSLGDLVRDPRLNHRLEVTSGVLAERVRSSAEELLRQASRLLSSLSADQRRGDRVAEGARLEIVCAVTPYRGFESHPLRQIVSNAWLMEPCTKERCRSGRTGRSRKPLTVQAVRGFESHPLRHGLRWDRQRPCRELVRKRRS